MKLRYQLENKQNKRKHFKFYDLVQVQRDGLKGLFDTENYNVVKTDIYTGFTDMQGNRLYSNDYIESEMYQGEILFDNGCFWIEDEENQRNLLSDVMTEDNNTVEIMHIHEKKHTHGKICKMKTKCKAM